MEKKEIPKEIPEIETKLKINGIDLPEKNSDKEKTVIGSYKVREKSYKDFYTICHKGGYSLNKVITKLIENFNEENKHILKPKKTENGL